MYSPGAAPISSGGSGRPAGPRYAEDVRTKLGRADRLAMKGRRLTIGMNDKSLRILSAPVVLTLVRGTTVLTIGSTLKRSRAAINNRVDSSRLGPATLNGAVATATRLITMRNHGLAFGIATRSVASPVKGNRRVHFVMGHKGFVDGLWLPFVGGNGVFEELLVSVSWARGNVFRVCPYYGGDRGNGQRKTLYRT